MITTVTKEESKVLIAYESLVEAVSEFVTNLSEVETSSVVSTRQCLSDLAGLYGMDMGLAESAFREHNDIPAMADKLLEDNKLYVRIVGTLFAAVSDIGACVYDAEQGLRAPEVIGDLLGTLLILEEMGYWYDYA